MDIQYYSIGSLAQAWPMKYTKRRRDECKKFYPSANGLFLASDILILLFWSDF